MSWAEDTKEDFRACDLEYQDGFLGIRDGDTGGPGWSGRGLS